MDKHQALLIGCGNIGALYDYNNNLVQTHAKAYSTKHNFSLSVYDLDFTLSKKISEKYNAKLIEDIEQINFEKYDCISICSPTSTHFSFLEKALLSNVKVIICEKPVSYSISELDRLLLLKEKSKSNIIINYIRRFQPDYINLKTQIKDILSLDSLSGVSIRYQKGFINNCSHALDLLEFLFDKEIIFNGALISEVNFDFFENDPTISINGYWNEIPLSAVGLSKINYTVFEIDLFFKSIRISITESGQKIRFYIPENESFSLPLSIVGNSEKLGCIDNYMIPIIDLAERCLYGECIPNNFLDSISLNKKMLEILSLSNGKIST